MGETDKGGDPMRYTNLHTHTNFSDGAHTVAENIASAVEKNMLSLGFSDHSYTPCDPWYCMQPEKYELYLQALARAKAESPIPIYAGLELDRYSDDDTSVFDYVIASVHYIIKNGVCYPMDHSPAQQQTCMRDAFGGSVLDMAKCYYDLLGEHVARVSPLFVGHFDVITKFSLMPEEDDAYRTIAADALKEVLKLCPYIELNTGAISRGWRKTPYPAAYLLEVVKENGGHLVLGSDSHNMNNLTFHFDESLEILRKAGIDHIAVFNCTGFDHTPI